MFLKVVEDEARNARPNAARRMQFEDSHLEIRMFNVDEGEAILVAFDNERAWLIDGGANSVQNNIDLGQGLIEYLEGDPPLRLEAIVASHPHRDHAGAFTTILGLGSPQFAPIITFYRSGTAAWQKDPIWLTNLRSEVATGQTAGEVVETIITNDRQVVNVTDGVEAHLFSGSGSGKLVSLFVQLRYRDARLLFTGDAKCDYESDLLQTFGEDDFRADVLKVTHHGSSSGTAKRVVDAVRPGIAIASTANSGGHRLERDTLCRLGGRPAQDRPRTRHVFETHVDGDIILRTDGRPYQDGFLYQVEFDSPGHFAPVLGADVMPLQDVDAERTTSGSHPECEEGTA